MSSAEKNEPSLPNLNWATSAPSFDLKTKNLGTIRCDRVLTIGALWDISKFLENENLGGPEFARELLRHVGKKQDNQNQDESEGALLSDSDLQEFTDQEIEEFARQYVTDNEDLYDSLRPRAKSGPEPEGEEEGGSADSSSFEIPKESGESDSGYLLRVLKLYVEKYLESLKLLNKKINKMLPRFIFSNSTRELYKNQMEASKRLQHIVQSPGLRLAMSNMNRLGAAAQRLSDSPHLRSAVSNINRLNARLNSLSNPPGLRSLVSDINRLNGRLNSLSNPPGLRSLARDIDPVSAVPKMLQNSPRDITPEDSPAPISEKISPVDDPVPEIPSIPRQIDSLQATIVKTLDENAGRAEALAEEQSAILAGSATLQERTNETLVSMRGDAGKNTFILSFIAMVTLVFTVGLQFWNNAQIEKRDALNQTRMQTAAKNQDKKLIEALAAFNAAQEAQGARLEKLTEALVADSEVQSESARQELQELIKVLAEALRAAPDGGEGQQAPPP